jgi:hypothetical protein
VDGSPNGPTAPFSTLGCPPDKPSLRMNMEDAESFAKKFEQTDKFDLEKAMRDDEMIRKMITEQLKRETKGKKRDLSAIHENYRHLFKDNLEIDDWSPSPDDVEGQIRWRVLYWRASNEIRANIDGTSLE